MFDYLVVGAGFAGATIAERLAAHAGKQMLICDKRPAHRRQCLRPSTTRPASSMHKYGPHIFHTNSREVFDYLSRFTDGGRISIACCACVDGQLVPIPINLDTVNRLYGTNFTSVRAGGVLRVGRGAGRTACKTSEDVIVSKVGRELYEKFFRNYTRKQWGLDPSELDAAVTARVPVRTNRDDRYFTDTYQVDAAAWLHAHVRADAVASRISRSC